LKTPYSWSLKIWQLNNNCHNQISIEETKQKAFQLLLEIRSQAKTKKVHPSYVHSQKKVSSDIHEAFSFCIHCAHQNLSNPIFKYYKTSKFHSYKFQTKSVQICAMYRGWGILKIRAHCPRWAQYAAHPLGLITIAGFLHTYGGAWPIDYHRR
jgi:hypothetical protein